MSETTSVVASEDRVKGQMRIVSPDVPRVCAGQPIIGIQRWIWEARTVACAPSSGPGRDHDTHLSSVPFWLTVARGKVAAFKRSSTFLEPFGDGQRRMV